MPLSDTLSVGRRLRRERERLNWSQERLAEAVGTTARSINRWEQGRVIPHPHYRTLLCNVFKVPVDTLFGNSAEVLAQSIIWNVPARRNPLFTGREEVLDALANALHSENTVALTQAQAISGLGGIGKTQTAIEYAYRNREDYQAVLWVRAETREILLTDLMALAELLNLPERREHDQQLVVEAVKRWLCNHDGWLLILDNVEDVTLVTDVLPLECKGHTLLTTRSQATGQVAQRIDVVPMEPDEGTLLLLRRAKLVAPDALLADVSEQLRHEARSLAQLLGGLPLALDQAAAYIEETGCSVADYLDRYEIRPTALLNRRGNVASEHSSSVLATFSLSLQQIEQAHPAVADLLRLCAFLQPDAIPEELFLLATLEQAPGLPSVVIDPVQFDEALATLRRYSLLKRDPHNKTLTIHRLVQVAVHANLPLEMHRIWAERALVLANVLFPDITHRSNRQISPTLMSQVYWCVDLITRWNISTQEATQLLLKLVAYLQWKGELQSAERLLTQAEALSVQRGMIEIAEAIPLWNLQAHQACEQGRYREAEECGRRSLRWSIRIFGPTHALVAVSSESLVEALFSLGKYDEAEVLTEQALHIKTVLWGEEDARIVETLNNLSNIYYRLEQYEKSAQLLHQAVEVAKKTPDFDILMLALIYGSLGFVYRDMERYTEAIAFLEEALSLREGLGLSNHPYQALTLNDLSGCFFRRGNYVEAERVLWQALTIQRQNLQPEHEAIAITINNLAKNLAAQDKDTEAEGLYQQALALFEQALGEEHLNVSIVLINLAKLAEKQGFLAKAALFYRRALNIQECVLGPEHPKVVQIAGWYKNAQSNL